MRRLPVVAFAALAVFSLLAAGCSGGGGSCPPSGPIVPPPPPTVTEGSVINTDNDDPLDTFVQLYFYPYSGLTTLEIPENGIKVAVDSNGNYDTRSIGAGQWLVRGFRVGYEQFDDGPFTIIKNQTNVLPEFAFSPLPPFEYVTSMGCAECHADEYAIFRRSGHPYKINKVVNNQAPTYPFTVLPVDMISRINGVNNTEGEPVDWSDVTYVIGGYHWKARFIDNSGYIFTGSEVQYNYETDGMVSYHPGDTDVVFNCGNCHTTGWRHKDAELNDNNQDGLEGIVGTWSEPGIQCEACHGGGALHAQTMDSADITLIASGRTTGDLQGPLMGYGQAQACKDCHTRDGEKDWRGESGTPDGELNFFSNYQIWAADDSPEEWGGRVAASGGFIKHHEQYDEILGIDPDDPSIGSTRSGGFMGTHGNCRTCHRTHETTLNQAESGDAPGVKLWDGDADQPYKAGCMQCHADYDPQLSGSGSMKGFDCVQCHMPNLAKSAVGHDPVGTGPALGDIATHLFRIDLSVEADQFTEGGSFSYPQVTYAYACRQCHNGVDAFDRANSGGYTFHKNLLEDS